MELIKIFSHLFTTQTYETKFDAIVGIVVNYIKSQMQLAELLKQKEALEAQIAEVRQSELAEAISTVKSLIAAHGLTVEDLFGTIKRGRKVDAPREKSKVAAKYRDPISGKEWSGRGLAPKWLQGKNKDDYLIA